jgi:hypothetical protein
MTKEDRPSFELLIYVFLDKKMATQYLRELRHQVTPQIYERGMRFLQALPKNFPIPEISIDTDEGGVAYNDLSFEWHPYGACCTFEAKRTVVHLWTCDHIGLPPYHLPLEKEELGFQLLLAHIQLRNFEGNYGFDPEKNRCQKL